MTQYNKSYVRFPFSPSEVQLSEVKGQNEVLENRLLPIKQHINAHDKSINDNYAAMGIKIIRPSIVNPHFFEVELPKGWEFRAKPDDVYWTGLFDELGRRRAHIYYKSTMYEVESFINFDSRIHVRVDRAGFVIDNDYSQRKIRSKRKYEYNAHRTPIVGVVEDFDGTILFHTKAIPCKVTYRHGVYSKRYKRDLKLIQLKLKDDVMKFINKKYPDFENHAAYWDLKQQQSK